MARSDHGKGMVVALFLSLVLGSVSSLAAVAQDASPVAGGSLLEALGLPMLEITVSADGVESPTEAPAGLVLLTVHNETDTFATSSLSQLPDGVTDEEYLGALTGDGLPTWTAEAIVVGGLDQDPMTSASMVVNLAPGSWKFGVAGESLEFGYVTTLSATGEPAADVANAIPTDLVITMDSYTFDFPDSIAGGPQVWRLENTNAMLHHVVVFPADRMYTADEVMSGMMAAFSGTPVAAGEGFAFNAPPVMATSAISGGQSIWVEADLEPGFYVAICFLPDPGSDMPHAMQGMVDSFEVTLP